MTKKRRNGGLTRINCGNMLNVDCVNCRRSIAKDKAIRRFVIRNVAETAIIKDLINSSIYETYTLPKIYAKIYYCISCAMHLKVVKVRSKDDRNKRYEPYNKKIIK